MRPAILLLLILQLSAEPSEAQSRVGSFQGIGTSRNFCLLSGLTSAQGDSTTYIGVKDQNNTGVWLKAGIGNCRFGFTQGASVACSFGSNILSVKYMSATDKAMFGVEKVGEEPAQEFEELGIIYGRLYREKTVAFSVSAGLGLFSGVERGKLIENKKYERIELSGVSILFEGSMRIEFWPVGIGGSVFGSANDKKSFVGWMIEFYLGMFQI